MTTLYIYAKSPSEGTHEWYIRHPQLGKISGKSPDLPNQADVARREEEVCRQKGIDLRDLNPVEVTRIHKIYGLYWNPEGYQR